MLYLVAHFIIFNKCTIFEFISHKQCDIGQKTKIIISIKFFQSSLDLLLR